METKPKGHGVNSIKFDKNGNVIVIFKTGTVWYPKREQLQLIYHAINVKMLKETRLLDI